LSVPKLYNECPFERIRTDCGGCFANTVNKCDFETNKKQMLQDLKNHIQEINRKHFFKKVISRSEEPERIAVNPEQWQF